jgi:CheY-like chemotaxis protein
LLQLSDFVVESTSDARAAVSLIRASKPDLILMDLLMPELGGFEICEMLGADPQVKGTPIIVLSAIGYFKDIKSIVASKKPLGVVACIAKPYKFKNVLKLIDAALSQRRA